MKSLLGRMVFVKKSLLERLMMLNKLASLEATLVETTTYPLAVGGEVKSY